MSSPMLRQRAPIRRAAALLAALAAMAMLAAAACTSDGADTPDLHDADAVAADAPTGDDVGQRAPDFTVESTAGDTYSLAALTAGGDPVLLYFFATWWPTCNAEFRHLQAVYPPYQDDVRLIGVDVDRSESAAWIRQWSDEKGFDWPLAPYDEASVRDYNVARQSTAFGIDAAGVVALRKSGGLKDDGGWREWLDILAASRSTAAATTDGTAAATSAMGAPPAATPTQSAGTAPAAAITAPLATADAPTFPVPPPTFVPPPTPPFPVPPSSPFVPPPPRTPPVPTPAFVPQPPPPIAVPPTPPPRPTATPSAPVGSRVGDRAPDFTFDAVSGDSYQLSKITAQGSPVLLYFFATWWPHCNAELRLLQAFHSQYPGAVTVLAIDTDPTESEEEIRSYAADRGFTFPLAAFDRGIVIEQFRVISQSSAVGIGTGGVIALRKGYGTQSLSEWRKWLDTLFG